jgi:large subunit ribosomal protein L25
MGTVALKVRLRDRVGKSQARKCRKEGFVPAVIYGEGEEARSVEVDSKDFYPVIHTTARENVILDLKIEGRESGGCKAIIKEIQYDPVRRDILHVDFQHISMTKEIVIRVPVEIKGEAVGVKTRGGILEVIHRDIEVECLPGNIPDAISVDVSELDVGDSLQVKDLHVENAEIVTDPESTVVTIVAPTVIEEVKPAVEAVAEGEEEEKPAEEGEEKEEDKRGEKKPADTEGRAEK